MMLNLESPSRGLRKGRMDWTLSIAAAVVLTLGTMAVFSSIAALPHQSKVFNTHLMALPASVIFFLIGWSLNYQIYQDQWKVLYGLVLASLVGVLLFGVADKGSKSWFHLPYCSVQPAEMGRIAMILVLANFLDRYSGRMREGLTIAKALALIMPPLYLVMKQPDFSSVLVTFPTLVAMLYCAGASVFHLFVVFGYAFIAGLLPILWTLLSLHPQWLDNPLLMQFQSLSQFGMGTIVVCVAILAVVYAVWWLCVKFRAYIPPLYFIGAAVVLLAGFVTGVWVQNQMKEYQRKRFEVFLAPELDPKGAGYNVLQAQIAIGSGGLLGKGAFSGTQSRLGFVPERHTDFIMAVVGEEFGFWGAFGILALYLLMLWRILSAAHLARDQFGYLVCCGVFSMFTIYFLINFGMSVGLLPVAGIPLPLVSYGGSNLVSTLWALGIVQSVYARRVALV
ncbi:MAG: rod shape-determining protein RodA [Elusimicrobia bacterium]|nr:rod shape-determining protein RodA [Elusimicrobiota bacterium]